MRILLFISLICMSANGQITFEENIVSNKALTVNFLDDIDVADIDGDGNADIVSSSRVDKKIAWYKNLDGQGTFSPLILINDDNDDDTASIATVDLDGDGDIDILSTSGAEHKLSWYKNLDGLGNFSEQIVISNNIEGVFDSEVADLDGDNDLDIVVSSFENSELSWIENIDGNGNFGDIMRVSDGYQFASKVALVDIDSDGDIDLLPVNDASGTTLVWFENSNGQGQFIEHFYDSLSLITDIEYSDFDGDSNIDIIVAGRTEANRYEYSPTTNNFEFIETIIDNNAFKEFSVKDFDGDNDIDILYLSAFDDEVYLMRNTDGVGSFTSELITNEIIRPRDSQPIDFDNDDDADFIVTSETSDLLISYENVDGNGNFERKQYIANNTDMPVEAESYDIDNDGDLDIVVASSNDNKVSWFENLDGEGNFGAVNIIYVSNLSVQSVNASDLDGDGDLDILVSESSDNEFSWFENLDGQGDFGSKNLISNLLKVYQVYTDDVDGDGDQDLIASVLEQNNSISWFENLDGQGNFSTAIIIDSDTAGNFPIIKLVDINDDNHLDVISSAISPDKTVWFENIDGSGNFSAENQISSAIEFPITNFAGDLDNDGDNDVLVATQTSLFLVKNIDGLGSFSSEELISSDFTFIIRTTISDLDNDGDNDIIVADFNADTFYWLENLDGQGNFGEKQIIKENADGAISINVADINGDGSLDIVTAAQFDNYVAWFSNSLTLGLNQENAIDFKIYPNPASTSLSIKTQENIAQIEIFDILGNIVFQDKNMISPTINISRLKSNIYFVRIKTVDGEIGVQKFIKE